MKRSKPGFKIYLKTMLRHPLKPCYDMVFVGPSGDRFRDNGSIHTFAILTSLIMLFIVTAITMEYTVWGFMLWVIPFLLHRYLRYYWTHFVRIDENDLIIEDNKLDEKKHKKPVIFRRFIGFRDIKNEGEETKYSRYKWWQMLLLGIEVIFVLAVPTLVWYASTFTPYSRFYSGLEAVEPPNKGHEVLSKSPESVLEAYSFARRYVDGFCREAKLIDYASEKSINGKIYYFEFENPMNGIFLNKAYRTIQIDESADGWMDIFYWGKDSRFSPLKEPPREIDTEKILGIILAEKGAKESDLDYWYIGAHFLRFDSGNLSDPGGNTWGVEVGADGGYSYFTVNIEKGTAIHEEY